jgi:hypothetical protein
MLTAKTALTSKDFDFLQIEIPKLLLQTKGGILSADKIYVKVKDYLINRSELTEQLFIQSFNNARKVGLITGLIGKQGRSGGVMLAPKEEVKSEVENDSEKEFSEEINKESNVDLSVESQDDGYVSPSIKETHVDDGLDCLRLKSPPKFSWNVPAEKIYQKISIDDKEYELDFTEHKIFSLIEKVFMATEFNENLSLPMLKFKDKKFNISKEHAEIFENYVYYILGGKIIL